MAENETPPVETPPATPPETPAATPLSAEQVDAWLKENNYTAYASNDPRLARLESPDPVPAPAAMPKTDDFDPFDQNHIARVVQDQTKDLPEKLAAQVTDKVMAALNPLLNSFAEFQIGGSVRPEAKPFVNEILKEFGFTPFQLAQDPKVAKLVNEAATARAINARAIPQSILFPADPPNGGGNAPSLGEDAQQMLGMSERFLGRPLTEEEKKVRIDEFEAAKRKEGLGV